MKINRKLLVGIVFIVFVIASFFAGSLIKEHRYNNDRLQRCDTLISFAIKKAENDDLKDQNAMKALISNVYAAYVLCDDPDLAAQLHDTWNTLIFEGDSYIGKEEVLISQLRSISETLTIGD
ncbi:MAG: hypothetical protein GXX89_07310 [Clostridiales bacterium]|jgi:hypothetical protein|nr:hypothetical protein [Clostridiales bacterium]